MYSRGMTTAELATMPPKKPAKPADVLLLDVREVAAALGSSERTVRDLISRGKLAAVRLGGSIKVRPADLRAFVESLPPANEGKAEESSEG